MARRRRWTAAAWRHGCPGVVAAMWILSVFLGAFAGVLGYPPWGAAPVPPEPVQVMTDVTNQLGVSLLKDFACFPGNVAFSPYGAASVLIVLWEGARGESGEQLRKALGLPSSTHPTLDYGVIRLGMRDIHRHLRTYFAHDGYLNGLTFGNTTAANIKPSFKQILRFYGYNPDTAMSGKGEMVTPPWMKHMTTTTPFSELLSTTSKNVTVESTTQPSNVTSAGTNSTLAVSTKTTTNVTVPTQPTPTTTKPTNTTTTPKPAKTTKSPKTTTQKTTVATTTAKAETSTTEISSTLPTTKSNSTAATPARLTTATENISTTLGDLNDTSVPPLIDVTDYTSSTRVTRRMPGSSEQTFETFVPSMPTLTISNVGETPIPFDLSTPTTQSLQTAVLPETKIPLPSTMGTTRSQEPSLSSMLTTLGGGKTSDAGLTTAFIIMAMTTKEFSPANLTAMFPQSLNLVTNEQLALQSTTPLPAQSSTTQVSTTTSTVETTIPESSTVTFEKLQSSYTSPTSPLTTDIPETTTQMTTEEPMTTQRNEDYTYSTTTEYISTTEVVTETVETTLESEDVSLSMPTTMPTEIPTTTDSSDITSTPTETTSFSEETTTVPSETENPLGEEDSPKSRQKRLAKGEKNFFPELQLHLHGNAMLSADDKDMDTIWQKYQERFGLPQGPFQVFNQGQEPIVKWVPIIRMVKRLPFAYSSRLQAQALMLPLDDERYKLLLILPVGGEEYEGGWRPTRQRRSYPFQQNEARDLALLRLIDDLHSVPLREIVSSVQHCLVAATIPPFLIRGMLDLTPTLARMGVRDVFDAKTSDLSGMTNSTNLWVRGVEQTVSVAIDINGIFGRYGAGYSGRQDDQSSFRNQQGWSQSQSNHNNRRRHISKRNGPWGAPLRDANGERVERYFMATRPFLFFVIDTSTGVSLMAGKVTDPTSTKNS